MMELPSATHSGTLTIMGVELRVHRLNNGRTVLEKEGVDQLFGAMLSGAELSEAEVEDLARALRS